MAFIALQFIAVIIGAVGLHNYENGAIPIAFLMIMMLFMFHNEGKEDEKGKDFYPLAFWAIVIIGDLLAVVRLIQNYI